LSHSACSCFVRWWQQASTCS